MPVTMKLLSHLGCWLIACVPTLCENSIAGVIEVAWECSVIIIYKRCCASPAVHITPDGMQGICSKLDALASTAPDMHLIS